MDSSASNESEKTFKQKFDTKLIEYDGQHDGSQKKPWTKERVIEVTNLVREATVAMNKKAARTSMQYYWMSKYDIVNTGGEDHLIFKRKTADDPTVLIIPREEYFGVLKAAHESCEHGGRDKLLPMIKSRFYVPKKAVEIFCSLCPTCNTRKNSTKKVVRTHNVGRIVPQDFDCRGQVDLVDFENSPDGEYKWVLSYQDTITKFVNLRPLKTNTVDEIAVELMKIFMSFGAPYILQSHNGREFIKEVVERLNALWPECKIFHGNVKLSKTQINAEKSKQKYVDPQDMLKKWMTKNKSTNWSIGCYRVQYDMNTALNNVIGTISPYRVLFGTDPKNGLNFSNIPPLVLRNINTEEELVNCQQGFSDSVFDTNTMDTTEKPDERNENSSLDSVINYCGGSLDNFTSEEDPKLDTDQKEDDQTVIESSIENNEPIENNSNIDFETRQIKTENESCDGTEQIAIIKTESLQWIDVDLNATCIVCNNACTGISSCSSCKHFIHDICGLPDDKNKDHGSMLCFLCKVQQNIQLKLNEAPKATKRPAEQTVDTSNTAKKIAALEIGATVLISVPKEDRGPLDTKIIKGKIIGFGNGVYKVGTNAGIIKNWFLRYDLQVSSENYNVDIPDTVISLKEAVANQFMFVSQKCTCKVMMNQCRSNRCACFKKKMPCGSNCHINISCSNKINV